MGEGASKCCSNAASDGSEVVEKHPSSGMPSNGPKEEVVADNPKTVQAMSATQSDGPEFTIQVDKTPGSKLGVDVDHQDGVTLLVDAVTGGLIEAWNKAHPDEQVKRGDRIVEVNGYRGDILNLVDECKKTQVLVMKIRRG